MNPNDLDEQLKKLQKRMDEYLKNNPPVTTWAYSGMSYASPSATDSHYPYQEPERDEQGTFYGYKILWWNGDVFRSPRYLADWNHGELTSDMEPGKNHMHGIHFAKYPDHPNLKEYELNEWSIRWSKDTMSMLVRCALSGTVVETDQGFRAQHAKIIGVLIDGHWKSYQDLERYSAARSRRDSYEDDYRRTYYGDWNPNP